MRPTNTKFYEQHLEKIVIGVALVIFLAVLWLFFWQPYETTISGRPVSSTDLEEQVSRELDMLKTKNTDQTSPGAGFVLVDYAREFAEAYAAPVSPTKTFADVFGSPGLGNVSTESSRPMRLALPPVPAVVKPVAASDHYILAEGDPAVTADLIKLVNADQPPRDFVATSVVGWFDLPKWYNSLSNNRDLSDEGHQRSKLLVDVKLVRQTRDSATGQWGAMEQGKWKADGWETIALVGGPNFRHLTADKVTLPDTDVRALLEDPTNPTSLGANQSEIAERPFPPVSADRPWMPPDVSGANRAKYQQLEKELTDLRQRITTMKAGEVVPDNAAPTGPRPPVAGGPRGAAPPVRPPLSPPRGPAPGRVPTREEIFHPPDEGDDVPAGPRPFPPGRMAPPTAVDPLEPLRAREQQIIQERNQLMGLPAAPPPAAGADEETPTQMVRLVAHDLTARPGVTYRYGFVVYVVNPFFHQSGFEQHPDFNRLALASTQPAWSKEITAQSLSNSFLAKVSARDGTANFQIWRVFGGQWQSAKIENIHAGEEVAGTVALKAAGANKTLVVHTGLVLVDVTDDPATEGRALIMRQDDGTVAESQVTRDLQASKDFDAQVSGGAGVASAVP